MSSPSPIIWTEDTLARFWDYCASAEGATAEYFTNRYAVGISRFLANIVSLDRKRVLDYGCGPGFLIPRLLDAGALVEAVDCSAESVQQANQRFGDHEGWQGARVAAGPAHFADNSFDVVCCIETIEHVLDADLNDLFRELYRVVTPGGFVLFTTPNDENLRHNMVFCANSGTEFHRWQHVRKWTALQLRGVLEDNGYVVPFCQGMSFGAFQNEARRSWKDASPRSIAAWCRRTKDALLDFLAPRPFLERRLFKRLTGGPNRCHLVAIASKAAAE